MTKSEYLQDLTNLINDAMLLPEDIVITGLIWDGIRPQKLLLAHDIDMERCQSLGEHSWLKLNAPTGMFKYNHCITMPNGTVLHNYEEDLPPSKEPAHTCTRCGQTIYQYYEGIPNPHTKPGIYCARCWEALVTE